MGTLTDLNALRIASPCPASWAAMRGDHRVRFCDACSKHVYDLSGLTAVEARSLIAEAEGRVCVRLYRRRDGTVLTADCPVGLRSAVRRRLLRLATAGVVMVASLRSAVWLYAYGGRLGSIPAAPTGRGVTLTDWADWAASALGLTASGRRAGVTMGEPVGPNGIARCHVPPPTALNPGAVLPGNLPSGNAPDVVPAPGDLGPAGRSLFDGQDEGRTP
jgi:hypothetical protein